MGEKEEEKKNKKNKRKKEKKNLPNFEIASGLIIARVLQMKESDS